MLQVFSIKIRLPFWKIRPEIGFRHFGQIDIIGLSMEVVGILLVVVSYERRIKIVPLDFPKRGKDTLVHAFENLSIIIVDSGAYTIY